MNSETCCDKTKLIAWSVGILGTFLIAAGLVCVMYHYTHPAPLGAERVEERYKNLHEVRATEADVLNNYAWADQGKGIVRLPIQRAMELTLQEWKNPAAARSNLIARVEKATAPVPRAPEKPNIYE
jgi:hypothetical protein